MLLALGDKQARASPVRLGAAALFALLAALPSASAAPADSARAKPPAARAKRAGPAQPPPPASSRAEVPADASCAELLEQARALFQALEYDRALIFAEALLARANANIDQRLDAYLLQGSSLAIIGDPIEAEKPFRFLLRGRLDFDLPPETPPKILSVFRKVQVEERAIVEQMRELERARILKELSLTGGPDAEAAGGKPLLFGWRLRDPHGVVSQVQLQYRREGEPAFSSLALQLDESGLWSGALPGEWTASDQGFALQYFLTTRDAQGRELLGLADAASPRELPVAPGQPPDTRPIYRRAWFWAVSGAALVALGAAGWFAWDRSRALPATDLGVVELP